MSLLMCVLGFSVVLQALSGQEATRSITVKQRGVWDLISALGPAEMTDLVNVTPAKPKLPAQRSPRHKHTCQDMTKTVTVTQT